MTKEIANKELAIRLCKEGVVTTPGLLFKMSQKKEMDGLTAGGVFKLVEYNEVKHKGVRIFNSRLVNKVKGKATNTLYKKSRLVI